MITRQLLRERVETALRRSRVVALLGPRQCGKTTLARGCIEGREATFFDLENSVDLAKLGLPHQVLGSLGGLVVLDEIQLRPDLLPVLRVLSDRNPLPAKFLLLGSASPDLVRGAAESLAGRIEFVDVSGFSLEGLFLGHSWRRGIGSPARPGKPPPRLRIQIHRDPRHHQIHAFRPSRSEPGRTHRGLSRPSLISVR